MLAASVFLVIGQRLSNGLLRRQCPSARVKSFHFKAVRPTFDLHPFGLNGAPSADGKSVRLWSNDHEGWLTLQGTAELV